jgi:hypothetical protein
MWTVPAFYIQVYTQRQKIFKGWQYSRIRYQKYMHEDSILTHSRPDKTGLRGTVAHYLEGDVIRAAEAVRMHPHAKLPSDWLG